MKDFSLKLWPSSLAYWGALLLLGATLAYSDPSGTIAQGKPPGIVDRPATRRVGKASIYSKKLAGRRMADGAALRLQGNNAASKTLPLGTIAEVTNVATGQSATVTIEDRGPFVKGRILDVSPATAHKIGIDSKTGIAQVQVEALSVPRPRGAGKPAEAAPEKPQN